MRPPAEGTKGTSDEVGRLSAEVDRLSMRLRDAVDDAQYARKRARELETRLQAVLDSNHHWYVRAGELERELARVMRSKSWTLTAPLRATRRSGIAIVKWPVKRAVLLVIGRLYAMPALWSFASVRMKRHPWLFGHLKALAVSTGTVPSPPQAMPAATEVAPHEQGMSAYQRRIRARILHGRKIACA